jgi:hypothetical protein
METNYRLEVLRGFLDLLLMSMSECVCSEFEYHEQLVQSMVLNILLKSFSGLRVSTESIFVPTVYEFLS